MNTKRLWTAYKILLSVALAIGAGCLIWGSLSIYNSGGEQIYTVEKIASTFSVIALPVYIALAMSIGGFIFHWILPAQPEKGKVEKNDRLILSKLHQRKDLSAAEPQLQRKVKAQQNLRKYANIAAGGLLAVGIFVFGFYVLSGQRFAMEDKTGSVILATWWLLPCVGIPAVAAVVNGYLQRSSVRKEITLMKQVAQTRESQCVPETKDRSKWVLALRIGLVCVGVALLLWGYLTGGWSEVLDKAAAICTECVGLG